MQPAAAARCASSAARLVTASSAAATAPAATASARPSAVARLPGGAVSRKHGKLARHPFGAARVTRGVRVAHADELLEVVLALHAHELVDRHRRGSVGTYPDERQPDAAARASYPRRGCVRPSPSCSFSGSPPASERPAGASGEAVRPSPLRPRALRARRRSRPRPRSRRERGSSRDPRSAATAFGRAFAPRPRSSSTAGQGGSCGRFARTDGFRLPRRRRS